MPREDHVLDRLVRGNREIQQGSGQSGSRHRNRRTGIETDRANGTLRPEGVSERPGPGLQMSVLDLALVRLHLGLDELLRDFLDLWSRSW